MENLEFVLGMFTSIGVLGLGYTIVGIFKVKQRSNGFEDAINGTQLNLESDRTEFHLRMDGITRDLNKEVEDIYRHIDSRFDKFENRLTKIDKDGCEPVKTSGQLFSITDKQVLTD
ncbi:hypothetical protein N9H59_02815 [Flavobacteriaceae bacterium]|nr:hypothetical protein [Flavobacteriaceae bacterium]